MKMKNRMLKTFVLLAAICTLFVCSMAAQAADKPSTKNFSVDYVSSSGTSARIAVSAAGEYAEVALMNNKGETVKTYVCSVRNQSGSAYFYDLKKNTLYYYAIRLVTYDSTSPSRYAAVSEWSAKKAFTTAKYTVKQVGRKKAVSIKCPKIKGIKKYTIYMSAKEKSGYKKVGTVKPGKSLKVSKFNKKAFKYKKNYYYKIYGHTSKGTKCAAYMNGFYFYKLFG